MVTTYVTNDRNEYTSSTTAGAGTTTYQYDANGNLISQGLPGATTTFAYNADNQLINVSPPTGPSTTYNYDIFGNLYSQTANGRQIEDLSDPFTGSVVGQFTNGGSGIVAQYTFGAGLVDQVGPGGQVNYYDFDGEGSTVGLTNSKGSYVNTYSYLPFGTALASETVPNPFQFVGRWGVMTAAGDLNFMSARYYSPTTGQFTADDSLNLLGGDTNVRRYSGNDPVNFIDPEGLRTWGWNIINLSAGAGIGVSVSVSIVKDEQGRSDLQVTMGGGALWGWGASATTGYTFTSAKSVYDLTGNSEVRGGTVGEGVVGTLEHVESDGSYKGLNGSVGAGMGSLVSAHVLKTRTGSARLALNNIRDFLGLNPTPRITQAQADLWFGNALTVQANDPNALYGPAGYGSSNYVADTSTAIFPYRIDFENSFTATAPAQRVIVTDQLDPNLDWTTFQLTGIGFGGNVFNVPANNQSYQTTVPMTYNGQTFDVSISASLNPKTGLLSVVFQSIDPNTHLPPASALTGFLPPEDGTGRGMGYISFIVDPKSNVANGTQIRNVALITFDSNQSISTDQVNDEDPSKGVDPNKQALVTIDSAPPTSSVNPLPATVTSPSFTVSWSGSDPNGLGITSYNVYVSDNGGAYTPWLTNTTQTSATYTGQFGHHYSFYSVATDPVGLSQPTPTTAQAMTYVFVPSPPPTPPPSPAAPPAPPAPPTLQVPPLLALLDSLLGGLEMVNSNGTESVRDSIFGIPLFVSTYNSAGALTSVTLFGIDITTLFE